MVKDSENKPASSHCALLQIIHIVVQFRHVLPCAQFAERYFHNALKLHIKVWQRILFTFVDGWDLGICISRG